MAYTKPEIAARFALQMAEQARKFGQRLRERRIEVGFAHQKDLVARMHELGDTGLNTNQLSRYENGEGPLPRESRLETFAQALETEVPDLLAGRIKDRRAEEPDQEASTGFAELSEVVRDLRAEMEATRTKLLAEIAKVRKAQEAQQQSAERPRRS